ncbi:hypothetical protein L6164_021031 [Bauhinia variegata]|uniref:Uncharacterized protein n=1 Tax=Bauhinia variegata TaxID=167791 RepID=A0ACB9N0I8_BAUVA|nr:hypothetical protein L6164_021031 [Bauhinia variegata]
MSLHKFEIEKFNGSNDFTLWKVKMKAFLVQQGCAAALDGEENLPETMEATEKASFMAKAHSAIPLSLGDEVLREVANETDAALLWKKLEDKYQKKSLTNQQAHFKRDCPHRKNGKEKKESDGKASASVVQESSDEGDFEGSDVLTVVTTNALDTWMMDSGASYHMTFNKNWFHSFKEWKGSVSLGDDEVLPVKGSGLLQIKMYDGIVRTFDAWYVPGLRKNLISLGTLNNQGYKFAGGDGQNKAEAVNTASYLVNRSPSTAIDCKTPQEVWYGTPSDYSGLRIFGYPTYAHVNNGKLEPRKKELADHAGKTDHDASQKVEVKVKAEARNEILENPATQPIDEEDTDEQDEESQPIAIRRPRSEIRRPANQSALCLAKNPVYHERSKHIDVKLNFIRDIIENDDFGIEKIATADNPADMLIKPLPTEKFKHSLDLVNVHIV